MLWLIRLSSNGRFLNGVLTLAALWLEAIDNRGEGWLRLGRIRRLGRSNHGRHYKDLNVQRRGSGPVILRVSVDAQQHAEQESARECLSSSLSPFWRRIHG